ncbi:hypothetical protein FACS189429_1220 [Bacteroidia bacterium]|nr:hypothetical protein FACS189429_1220 [Bacteroidia bacterium]
MWQQSDKYKGKYRIPSNRLYGYDYCANGCYYVTICTKNREHSFGEIVQTNDDVQRDVETRLIASLPAAQSPTFLQPTPIDEIAEKYWLEIPQHFPFVVLDEFVIMPNHIHGILFFCKDDDAQNTEAQYLETIRQNIDTNAGRDAINCVSTDTGIKQIGGITGIHNPMFYNSLGRVMRWFKGRVTFECGKINENIVWQERFHDSILRSNDDLNFVRNYIFNNPMNWNTDELNEKNNPPTDNVQS